jgi:hypothetical protein
MVVSPDVAGVKRAEVFREFDRQRALVDHGLHGGGRGGREDRPLTPGAERQAEFAAFLVERGTGSVSVSPDSFILVKQYVAAAEAKLGSKRA